MSKVATLRRVAPSPPEPPLSPARQALAAEIQRIRILDQRHAALIGATEAARDAVYEANRVVDAAEAALDASKKAAADHLVDLAAGNASTPPKTIREARTALQDAQDDLDARIAARDALIAQLQDAEKFPTSKQHYLKEAALNVIRTDGNDIIMSIVAEVERLQRDLVRSGLMLEWLATAHVFSTDDRPGRAQCPADDRINTAWMRLRTPPETWNELMRIPELRGDIVWAETCDSLMRDATAPLPDIG